MRTRTKALVVISSLLAVSAASSMWPSTSGSHTMRAESANASGEPADTTAAVESEYLWSTENEPAVPPDTGNDLEAERTPPIIGHFRGRTHTITIHVSSEGPRFTVATANGRVLAEALSADEIEAKHPEIYKLYRATFAQSGSYLDASVSLRAMSH